MTFSAVLLAGGESRRMGRDKATLIFRGRPFWEGQMQVLRDLSPEKIFVSARSEPSWLPPATELLLDEPPSRGPLSGLARALDRMETSHLIVLAVDMPFMTTGQMRSLRGFVTENCGVIPAIGERVEPLAAIYPRTAAADFSTALAGSDFSLQKLARNLARAGKVRIIDGPEEEQSLYRSLNEPGDF